jgi:Flp pilus assembly protein TadG
LDNERGASAVEFALIASLLFMILFGIITFGITFNRVQGLQASAREGARLGALSSSTRADIVSRVKDSVQSAIIAKSNIADTCNANPPTSLTDDHGCVLVYVRSAPPASGTTCPTTCGTEVTTSTASPCGAPPAGSTAPSVVVLSWFKLRIDIPLWSSPTMLVHGLGEFRCEQ